MQQVHKLATHYWSPIPETLTYCQKISQKYGPNILEIGPGHIPFAGAVQYVDWQPWPNLKDKKVTVVDINSEPLPFKNKEFDFVYCRHTIEDLYNPLLVVKEMSRIARAGYIETPSPIAECARGVDGGSAPWRGYHHHRSILWQEAGALCVVAKYPIIEHVTFDENKLITLLKSGPLFWNTYFSWQDEIEIRILKHDIDFKITVDYAEVLSRAINASLKSSKEFGERVAKGI